MLHFKVILSSLNVAINSASSVPDTQVFTFGYEITFRIYIFENLDLWVLEDWNVTEGKNKGNELKDLSVENKWQKYKQ